MDRVKRICVFEHSVGTNFNCACPAIQRGQGSGCLSEGSSWLTAGMRRLAWTFTVRIGDKYQIRLTRPICCGCSLELPQQGDSNEYQLHVFMEKSGKLSLNYLICSTVKEKYLPRLPVEGKELCLRHKSVLEFEWMAWNGSNSISLPSVYKKDNDYAFEYHVLSADTIIPAYLYSHAHPCQT